MKIRKVVCIFKHNFIYIEVGAAQRGISSVTNLFDTTTCVEQSVTLILLPPKVQHWRLLTTMMMWQSTSAIRTTLQRASIYILHTNHFKPPHDYGFPNATKGCSFQHRWLELFPWLVYSKLENGSYCLPCVLLASTGYHGSNPGVLVSCSLTTFNKALELLRKHCEQEHPKASLSLELMNS